MAEHSDHQVVGRYNWLYATVENVTEDVGEVRERGSCRTSEMDICMQLLKVWETIILRWKEVLGLSKITT